MPICTEPYGKSLLPATIISSFGITGIYSLNRPGASYGAMQPAAMYQEPKEVPDKLEPQTGAETDLSPQQPRFRILP